MPSPHVLRLRRVSLLLLPVLVCCLSDPSRALASEAKPNIIFILADDLGWGSLGCYGADASLVNTPNIDRLAREGTRFTDASVTASICTPSRYAFLTGRYCWRTPLKYQVLRTEDPLLIEPGRLTIASLLKERGYRTAVIGKWHLGFGQTKPVDYLKPLRPGPLELGFDHFYGLASNHGDRTGVYLTTEQDSAGERFVTIEGLRSDKMQPLGKNAYGSPFAGFDAPQRSDREVTRHLTEKVVEWIGAQTSGQPFFLYYAPVAVHQPVTPSGEMSGRSKAGPYGDFIQDLDTSVGRILDELDERGLSKNTLVIFSSDNGGEDRNFAREEREAIGRGLEMNGPLRAGKHTIFEGGLRVPYIARWPGRIPAGRVSDEPVSVGDTLATVAALTGAPLPPPDEAAEDSFNILPALLGERTDPATRPVRVGHSGFGVFSVRQGPWKWIEGIPAHPKRPRAASDQYFPQLYNLEEDPREQRNVLATHPDIAGELALALETIRTRGHSR
jgi:arylsulfatase A